MNTHRRHEPLGINVGRLSRLAAIGGGVFLLALLASLALWILWLRPPMTSEVSPQMPQPPIELALLRAQQQQRLQGYGWINQADGIAHIPIRRAMELLATAAERDTSSRENVGKPSANKSDESRPTPEAEP